MGPVQAIAGQGTVLLPRLIGWSRDAPHVKRRQDRCTALVGRPHPTRNAFPKQGPDQDAPAHVVPPCRYNCPSGRPQYYCASYYALWTSSSASNPGNRYFTLVVHYSNPKGLSAVRWPDPACPPACPPLYCLYLIA